MTTGEVEAMFFCLIYHKVAQYLSYVFIPKNPIFLYNFGQKSSGLTLNVCKIL
jgi:hypothetical protein